MGKDKVSDDDRSNRGHDPDTDLHLDGEEDTLYSDGLDIQEDSETLSGTRGISPASIKP